MSSEPIPTTAALLEAFRAHYHRFVQSIQQAVQSGSDTNVLNRLRDDIEQYRQLVEEYSNIFDEHELGTLRSNVAAMQLDIVQQLQDVIDSSHHGRPTVVEVVHTGDPGRPHIHINEDFLRWAYSLRSVSSIARYLHVGRTTVRSALIDYGIAEPQQNPFPPLADDELLDPSHPNPDEIPIPNDPVIVSFTGPLSTISDDDLDDLLHRLRSHFTRAGITILDGMLRRLGHSVPRERIRFSLRRIDPVHRIFEHIRIRRRVYSVPGPNSLWHHDGQHKLIRWGIVIHGFIDGYSRLITGLRASDNNRGETVLNLFLDAAALYGVPSRVRGDHGIENIRLAAWMEHFMGEFRGSYIWGRSVHNVRIERLWVDIGVQITSTWADHFTRLELQHGLDINNSNHTWLLHHLFLPPINTQLSFFAESWNQHRMQIRDGPNRSPTDMFGFDMLVHGVRGYRLPTQIGGPTLVFPHHQLPILPNPGQGQSVNNEELPSEELEVFGVDWEGLEDNTLRQSLAEGHSQSGQGSSWIGRQGPPAHLGGVELDGPNVPLSPAEINALDVSVAQWVGNVDPESVDRTWLQALSFVYNLNSQNL